MIKQLYAHENDEKRNCKREKRRAVAPSDITGKQRSRNEKKAKKKRKEKRKKSKKKKPRNDYNPLYRQIYNMKKYGDSGA